MLYTFFIIVEQLNFKLMETEYSKFKYFPLLVLVIALFESFQNYIVQLFLGKRM